MKKSFQDLKSGYYYHVIQYNATFVKANCYNQRAVLQQLQFSREYFDSLVKDGAVIFTGRKSIVSNKANYLGK